ncbi:MAG: family 10 glycosylhydrolase [Cellulosilyticum sp.]|nr:family 10 glycosylhydrolase [Cellulosilyticum sp.]
MKRIVAMLLICFLGFMAIPTMAGVHENDMRAVWISTVYNLDYPSTKNNVTAQQNEFIEKLDKLQAMGINTVVVQVRPKADALYASSINPWSDVLTGTQGKNPGYDPLAFMVQAAHARGMELHAWLNPYRVTTSGTDLTALCASHPARLNPLWIFMYNNAIYYNPEVEGVKQHIVDTVKEIAMNYDVDGIHFDDYFYPSNYPLPQGETKDGMVANARREAINDMVCRVSSAIKTVNNTYGKDIKFGISPPGIWKNKVSDATGSNTNGRESYYALFADTRTWIQNDWIDYVVPQIYWNIGHSKADYATLVKWWSNEVFGTNVKLYIGQGIYTDSVATEIDTQLKLNKEYPAIKGSMYFSLRDLLGNRQSCATKITNFYQGNTSSGGEDLPSITPPSNAPSDTPSNGGTNSGNNGSTSAPTQAELEANIGKVGTVTATTLNIRAGARVDRDVVAKVSSGTKVTILSVLNGWYKVKLTDGTVGWASSEYITVSATSNPPSNSGTSNTPSPSVTYPAKGTVTATTLNIRAGARTDRDVVATVSKGTTLTVVDKLNDWYKVKLSNGTVGWASSAYVSLGGSTTTTPTVTFPRVATTNTSVQLRSGARADRPVVTTVAKGTKVTLLDTLNGWYKVKLSNGTVGWASTQYFAVDSSNTSSGTSTRFPRTASVTATSLNIRSGARTDRPVVTTVSKGTKVTLLDQLGDWYKVKLSNGTVGWAVKSYIA